MHIRDLATALDVPPGLLSRIERGVTEPDDDVIHRLAAYFADSGDELLLAAGRLPPDLQRILQEHPAESALLLRERFATAAPATAGSTEPSTLPAALVSAVAEWAIRSPADVVLDPHCGDGEFLAAAGTRLLQLGAPRGALTQLHGYDVEAEACARATQRLHEIGAPSAAIRCADFLSVESRSRLPFSRSGPPAATVLIGAVPAEGRVATVAQRARARRVAAEAGVELPERTAPWASLLVHAASFVRPDGRLALIVPAGILQARYAAAVRAYLAQLFPDLTIVTFSRPVARTGEVVVLLGDTTGAPGVRSVRIGGVGDLPAALRHTEESSASLPRVAEPRVLRWSGTSLPSAGAALLTSLQREGLLRRLGDLVRVDRGVVTGANRFFELDDATAAGVATEFVQPVLRAAGAAHGLIFRSDDWTSIRDAGQRCFLLCIPGAAALDARTRRYLDQGARDGVPSQATCRRRPHWYVLPRAERPAAFLTYLCPRVPRMLVNEANVTHTNVLHSVQPRPGVNITAVAASVLTTAALLGCELLGRHYGNGVLKLEPTEVENLLIPYAPEMSEKAATWLSDADAVWRQGREGDAIALLDRYLLREQLGVAEPVLDELQQWYHAERDRRRARSGSATS